MKEKNIIVVSFITVCILIGIVFVYFDDKSWKNKMSKIKLLTSSDEIKMDIRSALYVDKSYVINDSFSLFAVSIEYRQKDITDFLTAGDYMFKKKNQDTIIVLRGHKMWKFLLIGNEKDGF